MIVSYARQSATPKAASCSVATAAIAQAQWSMVWLYLLYTTVHNYKQSLECSHNEAITAATAE